MKSLHISGNIYGCGNIGDDAVLEGILIQLGQSMPGVRVSVSTDKAKPLPFLPAEIARVPSYDLEADSKAIARCDMFISGGGTMIGDELGVNFPLIHNLKRFAAAKRMGKRTMMMGIGANRLNSHGGRSLAKRLLKLCDIASVRDQESFAVCAGLGMPAGRLSLAADPAFRLGPTETPRTVEVKRRLRNLDKPLLGVNVVNEAWRGNREYKRAITEGVDRLAAQDGYLPVLFCNEVRPGERYDQAANSEVAGMLNCRHEIIDPVYWTPREMIDILSAFDAVLSMRMHALIFAAIAGVPFVTVARVDKVDNFMSLFGLEADGHIGDCDGSQLAEAVRKRVRDWPELGGRIRARIADLRVGAQRNHEALRDAIARPPRRWGRLSAQRAMRDLRRNESPSAIKKGCKGEGKSYRAFRFARRCCPTPLKMAIRRAVR